MWYLGFLYVLHSLKVVPSKLLQAQVRLVRLKGPLLLGGDRLDLVAWHSDDLRRLRASSRAYEVSLVGRIHYLSAPLRMPSFDLVFLGEHTARSATYLP